MCAQEVEAPQLLGASDDAAPKHAVRAKVSLKRDQAVFYGSIKPRGCVRFISCWWPFLTCWQCCRRCSQRYQPPPQLVLLGQLGEERSCGGERILAVDAPEFEVKCHSSHPAPAPPSKGSSDHALYIIDATKGTTKRTLYNKTSGHSE